MNTPVSQLFYLKRAKADKMGNAPIYLRITVDGKRAELSTKKIIQPNNWDVEKGYAKGTKEDARIINQTIDGLKNKVNKIVLSLEHDEKQITAEVIKNSLLGVTEKKYTIKEIFEYHNKMVWAKVGKDYVEKTAQRYDITLNKVVAFLKAKHSKSDVELSEINFKFVTDFEFYLKTNDNLQNNTAMKYIKNFKKIIRIAFSNGWIEKDPFYNFKCKTEEKNRDFLTMEEIELLKEKEFSIPRLAEVRDIFLFACYTGYAYSDVEKLTTNDISKGIDGNKWIMTNRIKTDSRSNVPLLPVAEEMINKYAKHPECIYSKKLLPVKSNQKVNAYLKEVADICKIKKHLTFHIARHTFATTITLTNGVPIETVSKMLGHNSIRTTQIYAKIVDRKVSDDMNMLREKLQFGSKTDTKISSDKMAKIA